jgi:hypothetical protein
VRICEASNASALDFAEADEPFKVLSYPQLAGLIAMDSLRQLQS